MNKKLNQIQTLLQALNKFDRKTDVLWEGLLALGRGVCFIFQ